MLNRIWIWRCWKRLSDCNINLSSEGKGKTSLPFREGLREGISLVTPKSMKNTLPKPRAALQNLPLSIHGARNYRQLNQLDIHPDAVIDFSTNSNPVPHPPQFLRAIKDTVTPALLSRYPDRDALALTAAIAATENVAPKNILAGNGTAELIQSIALAYVEKGSRHLIIAPTFGEYARAVQLMGGRTREIRPTRADFRFSPAEIIAEIERFRPNGIWLCNPNNPTGQQWTRAELAQLFAAAPNALWVIDEAYRHFTAKSVSAWDGASNKIILRSLTKDFALAGVRLGYALAPAEIIAALKKTQAPWSVNSLAQVAGVIAHQPENWQWMRAGLAKLRQHAQTLWDDLSALGFPPLPTDTTFGLVKVDDAAQTHRQLLTRGILVRDATSFGLPDHIRIAAQLPAQNEKLLAAMKAIEISN